MNSIGLDGAGNVHEIFVDHGHECDVMPRGEVVKHGIKLANVVGAIVGRKSDAGKQNLDAAIGESGEHGVEVVARLIEWKTAQTVVAAEFNDDNFRMKKQDRRQSFHGVLGGGAACSQVLNLVVVAEFVEVALQSIRERLTGRQIVACCNAVAVADDDGPAGSEEWKRCHNQTKCNEKSPER